MAQDIAAELALEISEAQGGGGLPFIRHGKYYELLITRCHSKRVKMDDSKLHKFAFMEFKVLKAVPHAPGTIPTSLQSKDDGTNPNPVGSRCSNSIDFDGNGAMMAGQNVKEFVAGLFGVAVDQLSAEDAFKTWIDLCRKEDVRAGGVDYIDPKTEKPVIANRDKLANFGCGMIIALETSAKELKETRKVKELAQDQRKYFTNKHWKCLAKPGSGVNSMDEVMRRRAQILLEVPMDDDDGEEAPSGSEKSLADTVALGGIQANGAQGPASGSALRPPQSSQVPPQPPQAPPQPPQAAADPNWPPKDPWESINDGNKHWLTPGWVYSNKDKGGDGRVISEADYRSGRR